MNKTSSELSIQIKFLELQKAKLIRQWKAKQRKEAFIKRRLDQITTLSMDGWPRTKNMKHYLKWLDLIYEAKIKGIYSIGTANCDVIALLSRGAKQIKEQGKDKLSV